MLSSDILEKQFGPTKLVVLKQNDQYRIIQTIAASSSEVLELSLVTFDPKNVSAFPAVHHAIIGGESMGKAYSRAGISFIRDITGVTHSSLPKDLAVYFNRSNPATIVEVNILVGPKKLRYCHILEMYSSSVNWPQTDDLNSQDVSEKLSSFAKLLFN